MKKVTALLTFLILLFGMALAQIASVSLVKDPVFGTNQNVLVLTIGTIYSDYATFSQVSASASELEAKEPSNAKILNSFTMRWKTEDEYTTYPLNFKQQINKIDIVASEYKWLGWSKTDMDSWINTNCEDLDRDGQKTYVTKTNAFGAVLQIFCAKRGGYVGDVFSIGSPNPYWKTRFEISNGYETLTDYLGTGIGWSKNIQNKVYIRFNGLGLFTYPKQPSNIYLFKSASGFNLFDSNYLSDYNSVLANDANYYVQQVADGKMTEGTAESLINAKISPIASTWTSSPDFPRDRVTLEGNPFLGGVLKYTSTERISFQNFVVYANSNFIQIVIPYGQPKILSMFIDNQKVTATKMATITASVQNIGNDVATFQAVLTCGKSSVFSSTQIISNIGKGETKTIQFQINTQQVESETSDSCTLKVCDTTRTDYCDSKSVSFTIVPRPICSPGEQYASLEYNIWKVYECGNDGKYYLKFACNPGEEPYKDSWGKYVGCKQITTTTTVGGGGGGGGTGECAWWDVFCHLKKAVTSFVEFVKALIINAIILIVIIVLILAILKFVFKKSLGGISEFGKKVIRI